MLLTFRARFADLVASGAKRQTIRRPRKDGRVPKVGETLYLYTGCRTKNVRKLAQATCIDVQPIMIQASSFTTGTTSLTDLAILNNEARLDGFNDWAALRQWFDEVHGLPFRGYLIKW